MTRPGTGPIPGLPRERTALAWYRTAGSVAAVSVGGARLLAERAVTSALVLALGGLALAAAVATAGRVRYVRPDGASAPAGALLAVAATVATLLGVAGLGLVLVLARG